jgi:hypothetical protein
MGRNKLFKKKGPHFLFLTLATGRFSAFFDSKKRPFFKVHGGGKTYLFLGAPFHVFSLHFPPYAIKRQRGSCFSFKKSPHFFRNMSNKKLKTSKKILIDAIFVNKY